MGRKPLWKEFFIISKDKFNALQSYYQSSTRAWARYTVIFYGGFGTIETNLPYSELRAWFRNALGESLPDHLSSSEAPNWEQEE